MTKFQCVFVVLVLLYSCRQSVIVDNNAITMINTEIEPDDSTFINNIESISVLPLERTENSTRLICPLFLKMGRNFALFDLEECYLQTNFEDCSLASSRVLKGRGHGEFLYPGSAYTMGDSLIYIYDSSSKGYVYNLYGELKESFDWYDGNEDFDELYKQGDYLIAISLNGDYSEHPKNHFHSYNLLDSKHGSAYHISNLSPWYASKEQGSYNYMFGDSLRIIMPYDFSIYAFDNGSFVKRFSMVNSNQIPPKYFKNIKGSAYDIYVCGLDGRFYEGLGEVAETQRYLFFNYSYTTDFTGFYLYDKINNTLTELSRNSDPKKNLAESILFYFSYFCSADSNSIYGYLRSRFVDEMEKGKNADSKHIRQFIKDAKEYIGKYRLDETDLVFYKIQLKD